LSLNKFEIGLCVCGETIESIKDIEKFSINIFSEELYEFIRGNIWLETGVNEFFRKQKSCSALCGYSVLGYSGVDHEIDNLIDISGENVRILIECKNTSDLKVEHIFTLYGKMTDIGCIKGYIMTTAKRPQEALLRLARAKNIEIISDIFNESDKKIGACLSELMSKNPESPKPAPSH